jgi:hypothetical protein
MAARINKPNHAEKTKLLIKASALINRLYAHANGEVEMTVSQVNAAKVVIGKAIPDLKAIEHTGELKASLTIFATSADESL